MVVISAFPVHFEEMEYDTLLKFKADIAQYFNFWHWQIRKLKDDKRTVLPVHNLINFFLKNHLIVGFTIASLKFWNGSIVPKS